jgi:hypothetical protein
MDVGDIRVTRRRFVGGAVATVVVVVAGERPGSALATAASRSDFSVGPDLLVGRLIEVDSPTQLAVSTVGDGASVRVVLADGASVVHGSRGEEHDFSDFSAPEELFFAGRQNNDAFVATQVRSVYRRVDGTIRANDGNYLETTAGTLYIPPDPYPRVDVGIKPGATFSAEVWDDPSRAEPVVVGLTST